MHRNKNLFIYALIVLSLCMGVLEVAVNLKGSVVSETAQSVWGFTFLVLSIMWAYDDSRERHFHKPFDFGFILYVLWPIAFPWYLVATRGVEGMVVFLGFIVLLLGPWLAGVVTFIYFTRVS